MALRPKLARSEVRGPDPSGYFCASDPLDSLWGAVSSMAELPLDHGPRTALRDSQRPEQSMASSTKRSVQRPSEGPSRGGRCAASWPFTPIVNPPEVAIMGLTRTKMQPIWNGEAFDPRPMVPLDLSYDHRVINGAEAARFMCHYAGLVSQPSRLVL